MAETLGAPPTPCQELFMSRRPWWPMRAPAQAFQRHDEARSVVTLVDVLLTFVSAVGGAPPEGIDDGSGGRGAR